jgi:glycosyltransferase involved in cell wall biosynthesis
MDTSILFLGTQMSVGGAQKVLLSQAEWFHQRGYPVMVAFFYDKEGLRERWEKQYDFRILDLEARHVGANSLLNLALLLRGLLRLGRLLRQERFSFAETFTPHSNLLGLPIAWLMGVPVRIGSHHGRIQNAPRWLEWLHGRLINSQVATALVAVSSRVKELAVTGEGIRPERVTLIPNGVTLPPDGAYPQEQIDHIRQIFDIHPDAPVLISVGRLSRQKGHRYLLEAMPSVLERFPHVVVLLVGDGPQRADLEQQARHLGVETSARFLGTRDDVYHLLAAADVFVLPSVSEGMPMALLEALGMGVAVVASNLTGIADVVEDGRHGLLTPPGKPDSLAHAVTRLLEDDDLRANLSQSGKQLVRQEYTVDRMCERYESLFRESMT